MRGRFIQVFFVLCPLLSSAQKNQPFLQASISYRQYPIDLEDMVAYYPAKGNFYGPKFWQTWTLVGSTGIATKHNFQFSVETNVRYNHFHWVRGEHYTRSFSVSLEPSKNREFKRSFKYDLFVNAEKKFRLDKKKERYFFVLAGIGYTNLNTRYNIVLRDTVDNFVREPVHYKGSLKHFSPRLSIGCQIWKFRGSIDGYIVEDPELRNLTSLWLGATVGFEFWPGRGRKQTRS